MDDTTRALAGVGTRDERRRETVETVMKSLESFSRLATPRPLRPYQQEAGEAIVQSVLRQQGKTFTVLMARQSGKNELAAQVEAYLLHLFAERGGQIVKTAPSYHPQIVNSILRLREVLAAPFSAGAWSSRFGHTIEVGKARILFFSADPAASVVGATASLLLAVDEAQDVDPGSYWRSFRPMASTTHATTVLYGTAWDDDNLLEAQRRHNRVVEATTGERLNFEAPWQVLAALLPEYASFVQGEIARLGADHPTIRTQYFLEAVAGTGRLFPAELLERMRGGHPREGSPMGGATYVAGVDIAGQIADAGPNAAARVLNQHDETVITIARVLFGSARSPSIEVVEHYRWRGLSHAEQYERIEELLSHTWNVARASVDATGIGAGVASFLHRSMACRLDPVVFTAKSKSDMGFALLAAAETGRMGIYQGDGGGNLGELWKQLRATTYRLRESELMEFSVPAGGGHDDFVMSLALTVRAAEASPGPAFGGLVRARPGIDDLGGW